jgi:hypothetical protein
MRKGKKEIVCWTGVVLIFAIGTYGCFDQFATRTTIQSRESRVEKTIPTSYRFEDIPLPPGMNLNRKESFVYETKATKAGLLVYEGKGQMERLANFFKQQMPNYQWRMVSNFELNNVMLIFIKEGWSSVIYITPQLEEEMRRIEIRVGPIEIKLLPSAIELTK